MRALRDTLILMVVHARGVACGAEIIADVRKLTGERRTPPPLYTALHRLCDGGELAIATPEQEPTSAETNHLRRYYVLTPKGQHTLQTHVDMLRTVVEYAS